MQGKSIPAHRRVISISPMWATNQADRMTSQEGKLFPWAVRTGGLTRSVLGSKLYPPREVSGPEHQGGLCFASHSITRIQLKAWHKVATMVGNWEKFGAGQLIQQLSYHLRCPHSWKWCCVTVGKASSVIPAPMWVLTSAVCLCILEGNRGRYKCLGSWIPLRSLQEAPGSSFQPGPSMTVAANSEPTDGRFSFSFFVCTCHPFFLKLFQITK